MKFLVASLRHELLPLAHRLRREGHEVQALVWRARYETAWSGMIEKLARHSDNVVMAEVLAEQIEQAERGELAVVTNVKRIGELFAGAKLLYGEGPSTTHTQRDPLWFGGWFTGEKIEAPHLLVCDWGPWTGGTGDLSVLGGVTLVRLDDFPKPLDHALEQIRERMKSGSFRGLFRFDVAEELTSGVLEARNISCGWHPTFGCVFMAEALQHGETYGGRHPARLEHRFVSALPVTIPPWPGEKRSQEEASQLIEGLTIQQQGQCFWFDLTVDQERKQLRSAGLDGFLALAIGSSDSTPALGRARALELAHRLQVPGKQYRMDFGNLVDRALSTLEDRYGFIP